LDESNNKEQNLTKRNEVRTEIPKLFQNAQKLKDLEDKMTKLEVKLYFLSWYLTFLFSLSELKLHLSQNNESRLKQTEEIYLIKKLKKLMISLNPIFRTK
jgi:hypothetical protein